MRFSQMRLMGIEAQASGEVASKHQYLIHLNFPNMRIFTSLIRRMANGFSPGQIAPVLSRCPRDTGWSWRIMLDAM